MALRTSALVTIPPADWISSSRNTTRVRPHRKTTPTAREQPTLGTTRRPTGTLLPGLPAMRPMGHIPLMPAKATGAGDRRDNPTALRTKITGSSSRERPLTAAMRTTRQAPHGLAMQPRARKIPRGRRTSSSITRTMTTMATGSRRRAGRGPKPATTTTSRPIRATVPPVLPPTAQSGTSGTRARARARRELMQAARIRKQPPASRRPLLPPPLPGTAPTHKAPPGRRSHGQMTSRRSARRVGAARTLLRKEADPCWGLLPLREAPPLPATAAAVNQDCWGRSRAS